MSAVRRFAEHPRVEPKVIAVLLSRIVRERTRFVLRQLGGRHAPGVYRLRGAGAGLSARIVHNTPDISALDQSFYSRVHEPPPAARAALQALGHPLRALDVGANVGMWGLWLHSAFDVAHLRGLEPGPRNVDRHRRQIELNGLQDRWTVSAQAATVADGEVAFVVREGSLGSIVAPGTPGAITVAGVDLFEALDGIDLLKLDIEGGEWTILADPRFAQLAVPVVNLEFHAEGAPAAPEDEAVRALVAAGYEVTPPHVFRPGYGNCWGYKPT